MRSDFRYRRLDNDSGLLVNDFSEQVVRGQLYCDLLDRLGEGRSDIEAAIDALSERYGAAKVHFALLGLERLGVLVESDDHPEEGGFWGLVGLDGGRVREQLSAARASVVGLGVDPTSLAAQLRDCGLGDVATTTEVIPGPGPTPQITIVATSDYLHPDLAGFNRLAVSDGRTWILCRPGGGRALVGPVFSASTGACWECLSIRLAAMNGFSHHTGSQSQRPNSTGPSLPAATSAVEGIVVVEAARALAGDVRLRDHIMSYDWSTLQTALHPVTADAGCGTCRRAAPRRTAPMVEPRLRACPVWQQPDGGLRSVSAQKTLQDLEKLVSPLVGPIRSVYALDPNSAHRDRLTGSGLPRFYAALHYFPGGAVSTRLGSDDVPLATSVGKGLSETQARVSCLAEAVERMSGLYRGDEPSLTERYSLCDEAIHAADLLHYSDHQYRTRGAGQRQSQATIPAALEDDREIDWTRVWSLSRRTWRLVPSALLFYNYPAERSGFGSANSNGDAAGNCLEEAILQGLFELVERDAVAVWWYNMIRRPAVDPASIEDDRIRSQLDAYAALGRKAWVLDLTHDLGIPVFAAVSFDLDGAQPALGFGAHLDPAIALGRAVAEMAQMMFLLRKPAGQRNETSPMPPVRYFLDDLSLSDAPYLGPAEDRQHSAARLENQCSGDLRTDIDNLVARFARLGLEICVHDRTRPEFGLSVVKVIVPGLRHFWPRYAPGRLYDVPEALGWVDRKRNEGDLNPRPILF